MVVTLSTRKGSRKWVQASIVDVCGRSQTSLCVVYVHSGDYERFRTLFCVTGVHSGRLCTLLTRFRAATNPIIRPGRP